MKKCNVGKQEQKRDSLSRSFLTVGNDDYREVAIHCLLESKSLVVIPESSRTRYQGSALVFMCKATLINELGYETLANVALLIEARSHFYLLLKIIRKNSQLLLKLLIKGPLKGLREMICTNVR
ncbi:hypothetical protein AN167_06540 [Vibrio splendidus]|nr:hypothetical protein AN167_06540 [Vibrio splendidus]